MYILPPSIAKKIEGYRWQSFTPPAAGKSRRFRGLICHRRSQAALGFTGFSLRGLDKVAGEWDLVALSYNCKRLHKLKLERAS